ncbi:MAG TPA: flagellin [Fibrobacteria bacterium]|nr:flagellin [Fibrobacteria bacterium]HOX51916.1 flagellin [Fibrobacteria bacterium]
MRIQDVLNAGTPNRANQARLRSSLEQLSTGLRINRASDDAAGLSLSEGLRQQIRGSQMAESNTSSALAMLQIAESGGQQMTDALGRMRELAIQAANGTYNANDRKAMDAEYQALASEVGAIAKSTSYNGIPLLDGRSVQFQVGASAGPAQQLSFGGASTPSLSTLGGLGSQSSAQSATSAIDDYLKSVNQMRSSIGSTMNRLSVASSNLGSYSASATDAESRIRDTEYATQAMELARGLILNSSSQAMIAQANQVPKGVLNLLG